MTFTINNAPPDESILKQCQHLNGLVVDAWQRADALQEGNRKKRHTADAKRIMRRRNKALVLLHGELPAQFHQP